MIVAIIDAFYNNKNDKFCARVTKIVFDNISVPNVTQYCLAANSLGCLISVIKKVIPIELDNLCVAIDKYGLECGIRDELKECGYNIIPLKIMKENQMI